MIEEMEEKAWGLADWRKKRRLEGGNKQIKTNVSHTIEEENGQNWWRHIREKRRRFEAIR